MIFQTGFHEIARKVVRLVRRARLILERRKLARAETMLGFLGWQQVDLNAPELQEQAARIHATEKGQLDLMNQRAEVSDSIRELKASMESGTQGFVARIAELRTGKESGKLKLEEMRVEADAKTRNIARFKEGILELQQRDRDLDVVYRKLSREPQEGLVPVELLRNMEMRAEIQNEAHDLELSRGRQEFEVARLRSESESLTAELARLDAELHRAQEDSAAEERRLAGLIRAAEAERDQLGKRIDALNRHKDEPLRLIGRCLADENIPPMNQPEALDKVLALRAGMATIESEIARSHARSAEADRRELRIFYGTFATLLLATGAIIRFVWSWLW